MRPYSSPSLTTLIIRLARVVVLSVAIFLFTGCQANQPPPPSPQTDQAKFQGESFRLLLVGDPFTVALQSVVNDLENLSGAQIEIEVVSYNDMRLLALSNAADFTSTYDIISFDVVWMGDFARANVLLPLDSYIVQTPKLEADDFLPIAYQESQQNGQQYGLPIQPHPELLWYNQPLLAEKGVMPPETTQELLTAAASLTNPEQGLYGICWNGQRGQALGQQMAHFYAAFGQPLLDDNGQPTLNTFAGIQAAEYALALQPFSPPDLLNMGWNQRIRRYNQRGCAMTYGWTARTYLLSEELRGLTEYTAPPYSNQSLPVTPLGTWSLGIPANIEPNRRDTVWSFLAWLTSRDIEMQLALHGNGGVPRTSLLTEPALVAQYPSFVTINKLNDEDVLADWMRPSVPQWPDLANILGTVYHDMLQGKMTPEEAATEAQKQAEELFQSAQ